MRQKPSPDYRNLSPNETASRTERHSSVDGCALLRLRFDRKHSLVQSHPLLHADQAEPPAPLCGFAIKTCAVVSHREVNLIRRSPQAHFDVPRPAVFYCIAESLL